MKTRMRTTLPLLIILLLMSGCHRYISYRTAVGTSNDKSDTDSAIAKSDWEGAYKHIDRLIRRENEQGEIWAIDKIEKHPKIITIGFIENFRKEISQGCEIWKLDKAERRIEVFEGLQNISGATKTSLRNETKGAASNCISQSQSGIRFDDVITRPQMFSEDSVMLAYKKQVNAAKRDPSLLTPSVGEYVAAQGKNSTADLHLRSSLGDIEWQRNPNTIKIVEKLYPKHVQQLEEATKLNIFVTVAPLNPWLELDIVERLGKYKLITARRGPTDSGYHLEINELVLDEDEIPERTEQKRVPSSDFTFVAALAYPKNATAIYDVVTGGYSVRYAYQALLKLDGKMVDEALIRGRTKKEYKYAKNLYYQNVFGGTGVSWAYPNERVQSLFANGTRSVNPESVRNQATDDLIRKIKEIDRIKAATSFGQ